MTGSPLDRPVNLLFHLGLVIAGAAFTALLVMIVMRWRDLHWSWSAPALLLAVLVWPIDHAIAILVLFFVGAVTVGGARWHGDDLRAGADLAAEARRRLTPLDALRRTRQGRDIRRQRWVTDRGLIVGRQPQGTTVHVPVGGTSGRHTLVVGATGSGKTVTQAWIVARLIEHGHGAVVIDPKGDALLRDTLHDAARHARRTFREWTPEGSAIYNPFAHGTDTELADKALAGETYSEPHYLRQAQRYLGHATRALRAAGRPVTITSLTEALEPERLDLLARGLGNGQADPLHTYLDSLGPEQHRGLGGTRDRLAILAESDIAPFLIPNGPTRHNLDLLSAVQRGDVVLFRLDADRRPLMAAMLAAAIVSDLLTIAATQQHQPRPTLVLVDEFSAVAPDGIARLFGRGRSAGLSLLLGTQELADLHPPDNPRLADQVLGNITTLIAHRQVVPDSAEAIAAVAGTRGAWIHTHRTDQRLTNAERETGTRSRGREFAIHPDDIKQLQTGWALVANPGLTQPKLTRMLHPQEAQ